MLCMCGMSRSIRTSSSMTRALHTFFLTSESSSAASANRLWNNGKRWKKKGGSNNCHKDQQMIWYFTPWKRRSENTSINVSMLSMRACALPMINWFTQAIAWDLQIHKSNTKHVKLWFYWLTFPCPKSRAGRYTGSYQCIFLWYEFLIHRINVYVG